MFQQLTILTIVLLICILSSTKVNSQDNNIVNRCEGLEEFSDNNNIDCKFNPDDYLDVPQIIGRHGYPVETHIVTTGDRYLLGLHRIPGAKNGTKGRQPVLLQHGLLGSSGDWILNGNNSLGFTLADQGYDVWLGNDRGNTYSKGHVSLPIWSPQYWNFSWHEMGVIDLPEVIYYITNITGKPGDLLYIGHSMGTTEFFVLSSILPQVAKQIKLMIALAPTAYMEHITSPIRYLAPFANDMDWIVQHLGVTELLPNNKFFKFLSYNCEKYSNKKLCQNILFLVCSSEKNEINTAILPTVLSHDPAGSSIKNALHYAQEIRNEGNFQYFDYGPEGNIIKYGNATPPFYPVKNIQVPIYLIYAQNDRLTSPVDVSKLSKKLRNLTGMYKVPSEHFGHLDFIFGKEAYQLVYKPILNVLRNFTNDF